MFRRLTLLQRAFGFFIIVVISLILFRGYLQGLPFYWEFINVDIAVQTNGDMLITETQKYTFTRDYKKQRYRYIPLEGLDKITDVTVSENDKLLPSKTGIENNQFWIRWQHQLNPPESRTFVLKYRVIGRLYIDTHDAQVYWKAIFADRKAPVKQAKVRVEFPEEFATNIKYFQSFGASANIRKVDAKTIEAVAITSIKPEEDLAVLVTFERSGTEIKTPQWLVESAHNTFRWIMLGFFLFFVFGFLSLFEIYSNRSRNYYNNSTINRGFYGGHDYGSSSYGEGYSGGYSNNFSGGDGGGGDGGGCGGDGGGGGG